MPPMSRDIADALYRLFGGDRPFPKIHSPRRSRSDRIAFDGWNTRSSNS